MTTQTTHKTRLGRAVASVDMPAGITPSARVNGEAGGKRVRIVLLFYPGMWPIRLWTRSPYGHVAIRVGGIVWEAVAAGAGKRRFDQAGADRHAVTVELPAGCHLPHSSRLLEFLDAQWGKPYDWQAVVFDVLGVLLGPRARLNIIGEDCWNCSRLTAAALIVLGWQCPDLRCPISPGDLYRLINETELESKICHR